MICFYATSRARSYIWQKATPREREQLLRDQATPAELALDRLLAADPRTQGRYKFQAHVLSYYADFLFRSAKLIIEVDGNVHSSPAAKLADARRTRRLTKAGYRVLRFWNGEVEREPASVMRRIVWALVGGQQAPVAGSAGSRHEIGAIVVSPLEVIDLESIIINTRAGTRRRQGGNYAV